MLNLIKNEWMKIFRRPGTYVMIGLLVLFVSLAGAFIKYQETRGTVPDNENWKQGLQMEIEAKKGELEQMQGSIPKSVISQYERDIAISEYRIEHDISPNVDYSLWSFVNDTAGMIDFVGLFTIIIAAGIVASEFNWGTIKLLLIRPIKRWKILAAKYITVLIFGLLMIALLFAYSSLLGTLLFGMPENSIPYLSYYEGKITEQSMSIHLLIYYVLQSIGTFMLATMAFMISAVFRNSSLAIGLSVFLLFMGGQVTQLIAMKYSWAKYILFANTNLLQYFEGTPMVDGMTLPFSVTMLVIYFIVFLLLAHFVFKKRDVAA